MSYSAKVKRYLHYNYAYCQAGTSVSVYPFESKHDKRNYTYFGMGMPGTFNFRGQTMLREKMGEDFIVKANETEYCMFEYNNPVKGGDCAKLWEKNSYFGK